MTVAFPNLDVPSGAFEELKVLTFKARSGAR